MPNNTFVRLENHLVQKRPCFGYLVQRQTDGHFHRAKNHFAAHVRRLLEFRVVLDAVFFFGLFRIVPAVGGADQIQDVIDGLFIPPSASRPAVQHIFSRVVP